MIYFEQIGGVPLLTAQEERDLSRLAQAGDDAARRKLVEANLRLVISIARRYGLRGEDYEDAIAEGNLGLFDAARKFDPDRGCRFSTYAARWIRMRIGRLIDRDGIIKVADRVMHRRVRLEADPPPPGSKWAEMKADADRARSVKSLPLSFAAGKFHGSEPCEYDVIEKTEEDRLQREDDSKTLGRLLASLPEDERDMVKRRYGIGCEPKTLQEIGDGIGRTKERVRQRLGMVMRKLKAKAEESE